MPKNWSFRALVSISIPTKGPGSDWIKRKFSTINSLCRDRVKPAARSNVYGSYLRGWHQARMGQHRIPKTNGLTYSGNSWLWQTAIRMPDSIPLLFLLGCSPFIVRFPWVLNRHSTFSIMFAFLGIHYSRLAAHFKDQLLASFLSLFFRLESKWSSRWWINGIRSEGSIYFSIVVTWQFVLRLFNHWRKHEIKRGNFKNVLLDIDPERCPTFYFVLAWNWTFQHATWHYMFMHVHAYINKK